MRVGVTVRDGCVTAVTRWLNMKTSKSCLALRCWRSHPQRHKEVITCLLHSLILFTSYHMNDPHYDWYPYYTYLSAYNVPVNLSLLLHRLRLVFSVRSWALVL
jgi:hypothetical protein